MRLFIIFFCLISTLSCWIFNQNNNFKYIVFLPLSLMIFSLLENICYFNLKKTYVYYIFYFQSVIRYCLVPIGVTLGDEVGNGKSTMNGGEAVFFMIIELLFIFFLFIYQNKKIKNNLISPKLIFLNRNIWLYIFVLVMFLIILSSGFFNKVNLIWNLSDYVEEVFVSGEEKEVGSLGGILFIPFKIVLLLILSSFILTRKLKKRFKILCLLLIMGLSSSFIVGVSRLSMLLFILPFYLILIKLFERNEKKIINLSLIAILIPAILITSFNKFTKGDRIATTEDIFNTASFNAYFSGVGNVAVGIDTFEDQTNKDYTLFFLNDLFQNVPLLSKVTNNEYKSNSVFNKNIYGHSEWQTQIVPLCIAGLFHFNVFGIGIYSCFFLFLAFYFERKAKKEANLSYKYVFYSLMLTLALVFMLNVGSMVATFVRYLIFIYLPFFISDKLNKLR